MADRFCGGSASAHLRTKRGVDGPALLGDARQHAYQRIASDHSIDAGNGGSLGARSKVGPVVALAPGRLEEEGGLFRAPVEDEDGARHLDAGEVEELVVLPKGDLRRHLGRAMQDGHAIADGREDSRASCGELLERKHVGEVHRRRTLDTHQAQHTRHQNERTPHAHRVSAPRHLAAAYHGVRWRPFLSSSGLGRRGRASDPRTDPSAPRSARTEVRAYVRPVARSPQP